MSEGRLVSPNEMLAEAKRQMLEDRDPECSHDWALVMNFFAANLQPEVAQSACRILRSIYEMPLTDEEVEAIVSFQLDEARKRPHE